MTPVSILSPTLSPTLDAAVDVVVALTIWTALLLWPEARAVGQRLRRTALALGGHVVVVAAAISLVGALAAVVPGDPVARALGEDAPEQARAALREQLGLHHQETLPPPLRPVGAGGRLLRGVVLSVVAPASPAALRSTRTGRPVWDLIVERLPQSLVLGGVGVGLGAVFGIILGLLLVATRRTRNNSKRDIFSTIAEFLVVGLSAAPRLVVAPLLLWGLAIAWPLLPAGGGGTVDAGVAPLVLPALTLALPFAGLVARHVRADLLAVGDSLFVRAARARGASSSWLLWRHQLPHALLPVVHLSGLMLGAVGAGTVIVERVFSWPGLGSLLVVSLGRADLPVVAGVVAVAAVLVRAGALLASATELLVDPRLRQALLSRPTPSSDTVEGR